LEKVFVEIRKAKYVTADPEVIHGDLEHGLVSNETASDARGYDAKIEVSKAEEDHAARILRIKEAQSSETARGVGDLETGDQARADKQQSQNPDLQGDARKPVRGEEN